VGGGSFGGASKGDFSVSSHSFRLHGTPDTGWKKIGNSTFGDMSGGVCEVNFCFRSGLP
jgi:hypothetical protein